MCSCITLCIAMRTKRLCDARMCWWGGLAVLCVLLRRFVITPVPWISVQSSISELFFKWFKTNTIMTRLYTCQLYAWISGMYRHNLQCLVQGCPRLLRFKGATRTREEFRIACICNKRNTGSWQLNRLQYDMVTTFIEYNKLVLQIPTLPTNTMIYCYVFHS